MDAQARSDIPESSMKTLYAAYFPDGDEKKYLCDAQGKPAMSESEEQLKQYLRERLKPEMFAMITIHPVEVKLPESRKRHKKLVVA
jgi:hypothetical protein